MTKGENTKNKIIQIAIKLAAKYGFEQTSFQMIADELKLSQSAVMYYFKSKNALFEELIKTIISHNHKIVSELMDIKDNAGERLLKHCAGNILWAVIYRKSEAQILILLYYFSCQNKKFAEFFSDMIETGRKRILEHLLAGQREKKFHLTTDPLEIAKALQDNLFGAMLYATAAEKILSQKEIEEKVKLLVKSFTGWENNQQKILTKKTGARFE